MEEAETLQDKKSNLVLKLQTLLFKMIYKKDLVLRA